MLVWVTQSVQAVLSSTVALGTFSLTELMLPIASALALLPSTEFAMTFCDQLKWHRNTRLNENPESFHATVPEVVRNLTPKWHNYVIFWVQTL